MQKTYIPQVDEEIIFKEIKGLRTYLFKKKGFSRKMVSISVNYGSTSTNFSIDGGKTFKKYPEGIAHFLEHKLFESSDNENIFEEFSKNGASVNAFTDYNTTMYYFSTVDNLLKNTKSLIKMVFNPHITKENVEKEKGIINEEIKLYMDSPQSRLFDELYDSLYFENPVRFDIAGTVDSVNSIEVSDLMDSYNAFYQKENMVLVAVGDIDEVEFFNTLEEVIPDRDYVEVVRAKFNEPSSIVTKEKVINMNLSSPMGAIAYKDTNFKLDKNENFKRGAIGSLFTKVAFGRSSDFYEENYKKGLINDSFFCEYSTNRDRGELFLGIETNDMDSFTKLIKDYVRDNLLSKEFYEGRRENIELLKKATLGNYITRFNYIDAINNMVFRCYLNGVDPFDYPRIIKEITPDDLLDFALSILDEEKMVKVEIK